MFTAVEKKNDVCKSHYFKSSNKKNPTKDIVNHEQRVSNLRCFARRKRTYTYENSHISVRISYIYITPQKDEWQPSKEKKNSLTYPLPVSCT